MRSDLSKLDEQTQIYFDFSLHGWSELLLVCGGQITPLRISGVFTDSPTILLDICDAVLQNITLRVALCDEPGGAVVEVKHDDKQQHTVILSVFEITKPLFSFNAGEEGDLVFAIRVRRRRLLGMLLSELWKSHSFLSEPSYQKNRSNFPHTRLVAINEKWDCSDLGPSFLT